MCGICGIFSFRKKPIKNLKKKISEMTLMLRHRGPDQEGVFISNDNLCAIGNTRLAIVDPSCKEKLPMKSGNKIQIITFNGEIYNHDHLRKYLKEKGCNFISKTDTEVLLNGLILEGESFLSKLDGMWAFGFYDQKKKKLILSRDVLGERHLFFSINNGVIYFASEPLPIIHQLKKENLEIETSSIISTMFFNAVAPGKTLIKKIEKLKPGRNLVVEINKNPKNILFRKLHPEKWFDYFASDPPYEKVFKSFNEIMQENFKNRTPLDVPYITALSGGIDSAIVSLYLSNFKKKKIDTIFLKDVWGGSYVNPLQNPEEEYEATKNTSNKLGTKHIEVVYDYQESVKVLLSESEKAFDGMMNPAFLVHRMLANKIKKINKKVIFMSDGLDELLGYPSDNISYRKNEYFKKKRIRYNFFKFLSKNNFSKKILRRLKLNNYILENPEINFFNFAPDHKHGQKDFIENIISKNEFNNIFLSFGTIENIYDDILDNLDFSQKMSLSYCNKSLPDWYNLRSDKGFFGSSIECRLPFQDPKLIEFLIAAPAKYRFEKKESKIFARKIVSDHILKELSVRGKYGMPFSLKIIEACEKDLKINETIRESNFFDQFPFKKDFKNKILNPKYGFKKFLWTFYCLSKTNDKLKEICNDSNVS